jgi:hypothetical protein
MNYLKKIRERLKYWILKNTNLWNGGKSVLVIEPSPFHGECLPGYIKYFNDLGYAVDVILLRELWEKDPLCRVGHLKFRSHVFRKFDTIRLFPLDQKILSKYEKILITTQNFNRREYFGKNRQYGNKILVISHDNRSAYILRDRIGENSFVISYFDTNPKSLKTLNPHYFGKIRRRDRSTDQTKFVVIGEIAHSKRNYGLVTAAVKKLIGKGLKNFRVTCVGRYSADMSLDDEIAPYFDIKTSVSYDTIYGEVEAADFILALLDPSNDDHRCYSYENCTGQNQLVLGFQKPFLISEEFARAYKYDESSAIIYGGNDLCDAMLRAMHMDAQAYKTMQDNISTLANEICELSLKNLAEAMEKN